MSKKSRRIIKNIDKYLERIEELENEELFKGSDFSALKNYFIQKRAEEADKIGRKRS